MLRHSAAVPKLMPYDGPAESRGECGDHVSVCHIVPPGGSLNTKNLRREASSLGLRGVREVSISSLGLRDEGFVIVGGGGGRIVRTQPCLPQQAGSNSLGPVGSGVFASGFSDG